MPGGYFLAKAGRYAEEAKRIISSPKGKDIKITALAHDVGFGSLTAFHKTFKKYTGLTPNRYKKQSGQAG